MELSQIKTFVEVARLGTITKASHWLHRTQPALSAQLQKLEDELGELLFDRTSNGMQLTAAGELFLGYAKQSLSRLEDGVTALQSLRGLEKGSVSLGGGVTSTTYLLPAIIGEFARRYPGIRLLVHEKASADVLVDVEGGSIDFGVVTLPIPMSSLSVLDYQPWVRDELVLLVPKGDGLEGSAGFRWRDLEGIPLVMFEEGSAIRKQIDARIAEAGVSVDVVMEIRSVEAIKQMVSRGIGAAFVSRACLGPGSPEGLCCLEGAIGRMLAVVTRKETTLSPAASAFISLMELPPLP